MKIHQEEIDAAQKAFYASTGMSGNWLPHILEAAYTVRKARKQAKRERQRKEKDAQVQKSVKPICHIASTTNLSASQIEWVMEEAKRHAAMPRISTAPIVSESGIKWSYDPVQWVEWVGFDKAFEVFSKEAQDGYRELRYFHDKCAGNLTDTEWANEILKDASGATFYQKEWAKKHLSLATQPEAPEWDGKFGIGEWETRDGRKAIVDKIETYHLEGTLNRYPFAWNTDGSLSSEYVNHELIRPWKSRAPLTIMEPETDEAGAAG